MFKRYFKNLLSVVVFCFATDFTFSQTIILSEDFSTASGSTPPTGWTVQTVQGDPAVDVWRFDNPGRRIPNSPIAGNFACFDSDKLSNNGIAEEVYLVSPVFNATTTDNIFLEFSQYFIEGYGGTCSVEVFNGTTWTNIYSNNISVSNPHHFIIEITDQIYHITNAQIRFKWIGNYSWFWILDNIKVTTYNPSQTYFQIPGLIFPNLDASRGGIEMGDLDNDGDLDLVITGSLYNSGSTYTPAYTRMYRNDSGRFVEITNHGILNLGDSQVKFGDFNNDGLLDIIIKGQINNNYAYNSFTKIFINNGNFNFTELVTANLKGLAYGILDLADYNNDGRLDILNTGFNEIETYSKIYKNCGNGYFSEVQGLKLPSLSHTNSWFLYPMNSGGWFDYNNDGLLDLLLEGKLFKNLDNDVFEEQTKHTNQKGFFYDFDTDGDIDIMQCGTILNYNNLDDSYMQNKFSLPCLGDYFWGDINNDGYFDFLTTGSGTIKEFINNANISFAEKLTNPLGVSGLTKWADYDNDGDFDLFAGTKFFVNKGVSSKQFPPTPVIIESVIDGNSVLLKWNQLVDEYGSPIKGITYNIKVGTFSKGQNIKASNSLIDGTRCLADIGNVNNRTTYKLNNLKPGIYFWSVQAINGGLRGGQFSVEGQFIISENKQASNIKASIIGGSDIQVSWLRGTGSKCIVFAKEGANNWVTPQNNINYIANSKFGVGTQIESTGWFCVYKGIDDNIRITNLKSQTDYTIRVFEFEEISGNITYNKTSEFNNPKAYKTSQFTYLNEKDILAGYGSALAINDFNSNGILDLINSYVLPGSLPHTSFYKSNANFKFDYVTSIPGIVNGVLANCDYNNDNCSDLIQTGTPYASQSTNSSPLFMNNCNNSFTNTNFSNIKISNASIAWCDYNNDGNQDVIFSGGGITKLFKNINSLFEEDKINSFVQLSNSSIAWGDYDNDNDFDLLIAGYDGTRPVSVLYENQGDGFFKKREDVILKGVTFSSMAWGDYDNDGKLDILLTGNDGNNNVSVIYRNTGTSFTEQKSFNLAGVSNGTAVWGDFNNDNYLDIIYTGDNIVKYYINQGNGNFIEDINIPFEGRPRCRFVIADIDGDKDLDIVTVGDESRAIKFYRNDISNSIELPPIPQNLSTVYYPNSIKLNWAPVLSENNQANVFSYNLEIWNSDSIFCSSNSNTNGSRKIVSMGNAQNNCSYLIHNLPLGNYYWRVQAINNRYIGGEWSGVKTFSVKKLRASFITDTICIGDSTSFKDNSLKANLNIEHYKWNFGDGSTCTKKDPKHKFNEAGNYLVKYVVSSENFIDSISRVVVVKERPLADFHFQNACEGDNVWFIDNSTAQNNNLTQWEWDYGDGKHSSLQNPLPNTYLKGTYWVKLKSTADNGCWDTLSRKIIIEPYPIITISREYGEPNFCEGDSVIYSLLYNENWYYQWQLNNENIGERNNSITIKEYPGVYRAIVGSKLVESCKDTTEIRVINITSLPPLPFIEEKNNNTLFCNGTDVELHVINPSSTYDYQWKRSGVAIDGANQTIYQGKLPAGDYSVMAEFNGCSAESSLLTLSNKPAPPKPNIYARGPNVWILVCDNTTAKDYRWYFNDQLVIGAKSHQYVANQNLGNYFVEVNDGGECYTMSDIINIPTGNIINGNDALVDNEVVVFPNPTTGIVCFKDIDQKAGIEIYDLFGGLVQKVKMINNQININNYKAGAYIVKIHTDDKVYTIKLIKE